MIDGISERLIDAQDSMYRPAFAASYRAAAACTRELSRLADAVTAGATSAYAEGAIDKPVVRRSPSRCIVQTGPVALTVAWLPKGQGTVADGELLLMVWRGAVLARSPRDFERVSERPGASMARQLWEEVRFVSAQSEDTWEWARAESGAMGSAALADLCVARLREAYAEGRDA